MPSIDKFSVKPPSKKFKKTAHRPWTIIEGKEASEIPSPQINHAHHETSTESPPCVISASLTLNSPKEAIDRTLTDETSYESISNQKMDVYEPLDNRKETIRESIKDQKETNFQTDYQSINNLFSNQNSNISAPKIDSYSDENWSVDKAVYELSRLVGLQKKILFYIGTLCIAKNDLSSGPISIQELKQLLGTDTDTIKTATQRLVTKKFVLREVGKRGTGGFSLFKIQESLKQAIIQNIQNSQVSGRFGTNLEPRKEPRKDTSNSSSNISTITNLQNHENWLPDEWQQVEIQPLEEIGFGKAHLAQIYKFGLLSPEMVKDSINAFSFDLQVNDKAQKIKSGSPLNYFMGIMKNGMPYAPSENYESPDARAYKTYIEKKKLEQKRKEDLEREAFDFAFNDWVQSLTEDAVCQIIPEPNYRRLDSPLRQGALELYFKRNHWASVVEEIKERKVQD